VVVDAQDPPEGSGIGQDRGRHALLAITKDEDLGVARLAHPVIAAMEGHAMSQQNMTEATEDTAATLRVGVFAAIAALQEVILHALLVVALQGVVMRVACLLENPHRGGAAPCLADMAPALEVILKNMIRVPLVVAHAAALHLAILVVVVDLLGIRAWILKNMILVQLVVVARAAALRVAILVVVVDLLVIRALILKNMILVLLVVARAAALLVILRVVILVIVAEPLGVRTLILKNMIQERHAVLVHQRRVLVACVNDLQGLVEMLRRRMPELHTRHALSRVV
jgi:hypothetical protein